MSGRKLSEKTKRKIGERNSGEKCGSWKGNNVKYRGLHEWVRRHYPKTEKCEICEIKPPLDLANKTGIYNREFKNWMYLCRSCHEKMDFKNGVRKKKI